MTQRFDQIKDDHMYLEGYTGPFLPLLAWGRDEYRPYAAEHFECEFWIKIPWFKFCFLWIETATERAIKKR